MRSTIAGTVASVDLAVGDQVSGVDERLANQAASVVVDTSSTAQIVVISTDEFVVNASVGASDLASVKKGLQAEITPTGATETDLRHRQLRRAGRRVVHVRLVDVPGRDRRHRQGLGGLRGFER